jgi:hypothetical protein
LDETSPSSEEKSEEEEEEEDEEGAGYEALDEERVSTTKTEENDDLSSE